MTMFDSVAQLDGVGSQCTDWTQFGGSSTQQFMSFGGKPDIVSLAGGLPAAELYPVEAIRSAAERALRIYGASRLSDAPATGLLPLRQLIADRISKETGGVFSAANVLLTTGATQGLELLGKVLLDRHDLVVAESPTSLGALDAWRPRCPKYKKFDWVSKEQWVDAFRGAKFVYTLPNYSDPTGAVVSQGDRGRILDQVVESGTWLVEDDPYQSLELDGPTGKSILAHYVERFPGEYRGPVVYLGTVSKTLAPGLRVGWIVAEPKIIQRLALAKQSRNPSGSVINQAIVYDLICSEFDRKHVSKILPEYRLRRDALCAELSTRLRNWFEWEVPGGGMFVWLRSRKNTIDTDVLYQHALGEKVTFAPSRVFDFAERDRFAMRLNFTRSDPAMLAQGVQRLERAIICYLEAYKDRLLLKGFF